MNKSGKRIGEKRGANQIATAEELCGSSFVFRGLGRIAKVNTHNEMIGSDKRTAPRNRKR